MKKLLFFICCMLGLFSWTYASKINQIPTLHSEAVYLPFFGDISEGLLSNLKSGNSKGVGKNFSSSLTLSILNEEGIYSRFQGEMILSEFFNKNKPVSVKLVQKISNNSNYNYFVYSLATSSSTYRIFVKIGTSKNAEFIEEFRIEKQNSK